MHRGFQSSFDEYEGYSAGSGPKKYRIWSQHGGFVPERARFNPLEVIVSRNGTLVPEQAVIGGEDEIRVIRIAHGG